MRILFANDGIGDAGGVESYVARVSAGLRSRGHDVALLHYDLPRSGAATFEALFCVQERGLDRAIDLARLWSPDVCYSHNMGKLDIEERMLEEWPVVKFMHGYFGTCIGGLKMHAAPSCEPCGRAFGAACLALYWPRRCGQWRIGKMLTSYGWAIRQRALFQRYAEIIVASAHMRDEYVRNGAERVHVNNLFPSIPAAKGESAPETLELLFAGRMTKVKGGDMLIRAAAEAQRRTGQEIGLALAGDGPQRAEWESLARSLGVAAEFTGWLGAGALAARLRRATFLVVPSAWPEPFGLVGLDAAAMGVPAIAFDTGGVRDWLEDGVNGYLARGCSAVALAQAIERAIAHREQWSGLRAAARSAARRLSLENHLDRLEPLLAGAARKHDASVAVG